MMVSNSVPLYYCDRWFDSLATLNASWRWLSGLMSASSAPLASTESRRRAVDASRLRARQSGRLGRGRQPAVVRPEMRAVSGWCRRGTGSRSRARARRDNPDALAPRHLRRPRAQRVAPRRSTRRRSRSRPRPANPRATPLAIKPRAPSRSVSLHHTTPSASLLCLGSA